MNQASSASTQMQENVRYNVAVNIIDASIFGLALGLASNMTVLPLFIASLTDNTTLIGLIASIQMIGWQLPQILTAKRVARLGRYKPMAVIMSINERIPFLILAVVALMLPTLGTSLTMILTFILVSWQAVGGGLTGTAWQSMISKIIPKQQRGAFWGAQTAGLNMLMALGMFTAGQLLERFEYPGNYALCFFLAGVAAMVSMGFLAMTRESERETFPHKDDEDEAPALSWSHVGTILRGDRNLWAFIGARFLAQFGWMAVAFYTIFGVREFDMSESIAGMMFAVLTLSATVANPILGWLGDRWGHRQVFAVSLLVLAGSALLAAAATSMTWLYAVSALAGIGNVGIWTTGMTMTVEFGTDDDRPYYIGVINTLMSPAALIAPFIGGVLADSIGFDATFIFAAMASVTTALILLFVVRDPQQQREKEDVPVVSV
jgi:MFS family permease